MHSFREYINQPRLNLAAALELYCNINSAGKILSSLEINQTHHRIVEITTRPEPRFNIREDR